MKSMRLSLLGMLAIASGEMSVRIWDLKTDDNFILSAPTPVAPSVANEVISSLDFCEEKNILGKLILTQIFSNSIFIREKIFF